MGVGVGGAEHSNTSNIEDSTRPKQLKEKRKLTAPTVCNRSTNYTQLLVGNRSSTAKKQKHLQIQPQMTAAFFVERQVKKREDIAVSKQDAAKQNKSSPVNTVDSRYLEFQGTL